MLWLCAGRHTLGEPLRLTDLQDVVVGGEGVEIRRATARETPILALERTRRVTLRGLAFTTDISPASTKDAPRAAQAAQEPAVALLRKARAALTAGRTDAALRLVRRHRERFVQQQPEDREYLAIQILQKAQPSEARRAVSAFLARFPNSLYRGSAQAVLTRDVLVRLQATDTITLEEVHLDGGRIHLINAPKTTLDRVRVFRMYRGRGGLAALKVEGPEPTLRQTVFTQTKAPNPK